MSQTHYNHSYDDFSAWTIDLRDLDHWHLEPDPEDLEEMRDSLKKVFNMIGHKPDLADLSSELEKMAKILRI